MILETQDDQGAFASLPHIIACKQSFVVELPMYHEMRWTLEKIQKRLELIHP